MLDLLGIVFSSFIMMLVILRAVQLDSVLPWFRPPVASQGQAGAAAEKAEVAPAPEPTPAGTWRRPTGRLARRRARNTDQDERG